jgi:hypothetical protein
MAVTPLNWLGNLTHYCYREFNREKSLLMLTYVRLLPEEKHHSAAKNTCVNVNNGEKILVREDNEA